MSTMKLQKLCYYSQGWSLAWDERPLFPEAIQAWANGPVVYDLYLKHRGQFHITELSSGDASRLTQDEIDTIDGVLDGYRSLTGQQLSDKTHIERPWLEAREGLADGARSTKELDLGRMQEYFGALAFKG